MTFTVGGINFLPYLLESGLEYTRNSVDGPNAGRTMSGLMNRDWLADKITWKGDCRPLDSDELSIILTALQPEIITVVYTDPETDTVKTGYFYSATVPATLKRVRGTITKWTGLTFTLVQF